MWAVGRYDLRLTDEEFWSMVPRQYLALLERNRQRRLHSEFGPAIVVSAILGHGVKNPPDPRKFMPSYGEIKKEEQEMPWQQKMVDLKAALQGIGG